MHIAIEGMDGVGKTSQAKAFSKQIGADFVPKSFHEMHDCTGTYDSYISINHYTSGEIEGNYGLRIDYFINKNRGKDIVTDRFYISNYWSRVDDLSIEYFNKISLYWGIPDIMIILYADQKVLYDRMRKRNPIDKDLYKVKSANKNYQLMFEFVRKMELEVLVIDTSDLDFEMTTEVITYAYMYGIRQCHFKYCNYTKIILPQYKIISDSQSDFICAGNRLMRVKTKKNECVIPENIIVVSEGAFSGAESLLAVKISENVQVISEYAFKNSNVKEIYVDENNANFLARDNTIYDSSGTRLIKYFGREEEFTVPVGVQVIETLAFAENKALCKITFPKSLKEIKYGAFLDCENLEYICIPGEILDNICFGAFVGCPKLESITISSKSNFFIENDTLYDMRGNLVLCYGDLSGQAVYRVDCNYIYPFAFDNVKGDRWIHELKLGDDVKKVGAYAFSSLKIDMVEANAVEYFGEKCFHQEYENIVTLRENYVPEVWNNSFAIESDIHVSEREWIHYLRNRDWSVYSIRVVLGTKSPEQFCGDACMSYVLKKENIKFVPERKHLWIMDLVYTLYKTIRCDYCLIYHKSMLMKDYLKGTIPKEMDVINILDTYFHNGGRALEVEIGISELIDLVNEWKYVLCCVKSSIFFNDSSLGDNSHFIIIRDIAKDGAEIINPGKEYIYLQYIDIRTLLESMKESGQWIACVGRK